MIWHLLAKNKTAIHKYDELRTMRNIRICQQKSRIVAYCRNLQKNQSTIALFLCYIFIMPRISVFSMHALYETPRFSAIMLFWFMLQYDETDENVWNEKTDI